MKRFFFDMDGTLARFYEDAGCVRNSGRDGFFLELKPYENMVAALKMMRARPDVRVYVLSHAETEAAREDKQSWLAVQVQDPIACLFCKHVKSKAEYVKEALDDFGEDFIVVDDYSSNLVDWETRGGSAVKVLNEFNGRRWNGTNFGGKEISTEWSARDIYEHLCAMFQLDPAVAKEGAY